MLSTYKLEGIRESGNTAPFILKLGTMLWWLVAFTSRPLYIQGKNPRWPIQQKASISWRMKDQLDVTCYFISRLCAQHVSDINISIIRSLRLCWWITTSVVLFSVRCVLEHHEHHLKPAAPKLQHTTNWEKDDRCGNSSTQSQAPDDGYMNVRNMLST